MRAALTGLAKRRLVDVVEARLTPCGRGRLAIGLAAAAGPRTCERDRPRAPDRHDHVQCVPKLRCAVESAQVTEVEPGALTSASAKLRSAGRAVGYPAHLLQFWRGLSRRAHGFFGLGHRPELPAVRLRCAAYGPR
jgi:hypothetical protein